jgi:Uma2 family endonuclease
MATPLETGKRKLTAEDLWSLGPEYERFELDEGELVEMPLPGEIHGDVTVELAWRLKTHVKQRGLGKVYVETGYRLSDFTVRGPDISFVRKERLGGSREDFIPGAPDLAVEVLSPHDHEHPREMQRKVSQYLEAGAQMIWVVDTRARRIGIYRPEHLAEFVEADGWLSGEPVVPGFSCRVGDLFSEA